MSDMDANRLSWDGTKRCSQSVAATEQLLFIPVCDEGADAHTTAQMEATGPGCGEGLPPRPGIGI